MTPTFRRACRPGLAQTTTVALVAILALAGCTAADESGGDTAASGQGAGDVGAVDAPAAGGAAGVPAEREQGGYSDSDQVSGGAVDVAPVPTSEIKRARVELTTTNVTRTVDGIYTLAGSVGGDISSEQTRTDRQGHPTWSTLVVLVPVDSFEESLHEIAELGTLRGRDSSTEDVTAQVADLDARVETARDSIARLQALFQRATKLGDVITLEAEIARRQADLESLLAQQRALADQTSMSEIHVTVTRPPAEPAPEPDDEDRSGFLAGLEQGWDALVAVLVTAGHALGAALPIALLLLVIALVIRPFVRPLLRRPQPGTAAAAAPDGQDG